MTDRTVLVNLKANTSQFKSEMAASSASMSKFEQAQDAAVRKAERWETIGKVSQVAGAAMAAGLAVAAKAASDQEQAMGALDAVFRANSAAMRANAEQASNMGLSQTEYANSAARLGGQLRGLGMDESKLVGTTEGLIVTAADMAAQFGGTTAQAVDALGSALRKERDPIEAYNVNLTDAKIKAEMAATGMTELEATLSLVSKAMTDSGAAGAMGREFDTAASAANRARAALTDAAADIGNALLPAIAAVADKIATFAQWFSSLPGPVKDAASAIGVFTTALLLVGPRAVTAASGLASLKAAMIASGGASAAAAGKVSTFSVAVGKIGMLGVAVGALMAVGDAIRSWQFGEPTQDIEKLRTQLIEFAATGTTAVGKFGTDMGSVAQELHDLYTPDVAGVWSPPWEGWNFGQILGELEQVDTALAQLFTTDPGAASAIFDRYVQEAGALGVSVEQVREQFPQLAAAMDQAAAASGNSAGAMDAQSAAAQGLTNDLRGLLGAQLALAGSKDALIGQTRRLTEATKENGTSLEGTRRGAVANREALYQELAAVKAVGDAKEKATGSAEAGDRVTQRGIANLRQSAIAAGISAKSFDALAQRMGLMPKDVKTKVSAPGADGAKKDLQGVDDAAKKVPKSTKTRTDAPGADGAKKDLDAVDDAARKVPKSTKTRTDAPNASGTQRDLEGVDDAARRIPGSTRTNVTESGASATQGAMQAVQSAIAAIDRSINIHTTYTSSGEKPNGGGGGGSWATGGLIRGPGTSTSDSIPAMLSDGEFVVRAAAVDRIGAHNLHRINRGSLPGFAGGGAVSIGGQPYAAWARKMLPSFLAKDQQWIEENLPRLTGNTVGTGAFYNTTKPTRRAKEKDSEYKQRVAQWKNEQQTIRRQFDQTVRSEKLADKWGKVADQQEKDRQAAEDKQRGLEEWAKAVREQEAAAQAEAARRAAEEQAAREAAAAKTVEDLQNAKAAFWQSVTDSLRAASSFSSNFQKVHGSYASDVERLTAANQAVEEARKALNTAAPGDRAAAAKQLADALKEVAAAQAQVNKSDPKPANVIKSFQERAAAAEKYQRQVTALQQAGLNNTILEQIATMGPDDAQAMIDSLSGMTAAQIQQLNAAQGRIDTAAVTLGSVLSSGIYDPAIAAARANPNYTVAVEIAPQAITIALDGRAMATALANYNRQTGQAA